MTNPKLSTREREIIKVLFQISSNQGIADHLGISINTVKTHLKHIYKKYNVHSKPELILKIKQLSI